MSISKIPAAGASPDDVTSSGPAAAPERDRLDDGGLDPQKAARELAQTKADLEAQTERMQVQALDAARPVLAAVDTGARGLDQAVAAAADRASWASDRLAEASRLAFDGIAAEVRAADLRTDWTSTQALRSADDERARVGEASSKAATDAAARAASEAAALAAGKSGGELARDDDAEKRGETGQSIP